MGPGVGNASVILFVSAWLFGEPLDRCAELYVERGHHGAEHLGVVRVSGLGGAILRERRLWVVSWRLFGSSIVSSSGCVFSEKSKIRARQGTRRTRIVKPEMTQCEWGPARCPHP